MFIVCFKLYKKKRGQFLRLRLPRHRQTPNHLKRVNAHAYWRELLTSVLDDFKFWRIWVNKNLKADVHPICPIYILFLAHRHLQF